MAWRNDAPPVDLCRRPDRWCFEYERRPPCLRGIDVHRPGRAARSDRGGDPRRGRSGSTPVVRTKLCEGVGDGTTGRCTSTLSEDEIASLATRLSDLSDDVRFVAGYEAIPAGQAPIDQPGRDYVFVSPPRDRGDGTFWIEAGETCGGLWRARRYLCPRREGRTWALTGNAPGTGMWVS